jgi:DNA-binding SARP family transcriptional activator
MLEGPSPQVQLLGPVDVTADGVTRGLAGLRRKAVLAVLGLQPGQLVSTDRLVGIVWGERRPATVGNVLQNTIGHLRGLLGDKSRIVAAGSGYALHLPGDAVDVRRAEELIRGGGTGPAQQVGRLRTALDMWQGDSLADVSAIPWLEEQGRRLDQLRMDASVRLVEGRLALGEHAELVAELERLIEHNPFSEELHRQLMLALYRCGRQVDALAAYQRLR